MTHYFDQKPDVSHAPRLFDVFFEDVPFRFMTDSGVFSRKKLDDGTDLLLSTVLEREENGTLRILDLGTGIGVMAIVLAKLRSSFSVAGTDINERAVALANNNARLNRIENIKFFQADGMPTQGATFYDVIVLNPPIRAGKKTVYRLFSEARERLSEPEGRLYIVIRVKQGAASASRELARIFEHVETINRGKGYHVIKASVSSSHESP
jgi:16S rRNA (guanine1207-N2)-methyltransferase